MDISRVGSNFKGLPEGNKGKEVNPEKGNENVQPQKDKIEISDEAKLLRSGGVKNLEEIKEKVGSGFYDNDAVIEKVADEILKELSR